MVVALLVILNATTRQRVLVWGGSAAGVLVILFVVGGTAIVPAVIADRAGSIVNNIRLFDVRDVEATGENFAIVERMAQLQAGWSMFTAHPLTGVGPGNYTNAYEGQALFTAPHSIHPWYTSRGHAHNFYLHIAAEAGIIGLSAYLVLLALLVVQAYVTLRATQDWFWRSIALGCCGIMAAVMVHNLFENLHVLNMGVQLGAAWGLLVAAEKRTQHE
jgi:O-antigen ligase